MFADRLRKLKKISESEPNTKEITVNRNDLISLIYHFERVDTFLREEAKPKTPEEKRYQELEEKFDEADNLKCHLLSEIEDFTTDTNDHIKSLHKRNSGIEEFGELRDLAEANLYNVKEIKKKFKILMKAL